MSYARSLVSYARKRGLSRAAIWSAVRRFAGVLCDRLLIPWKTRPIRRDFGFAHGTPVDRHYIERFLRTNQELVHGLVLEFGDDEYFRKFAAPDSSVSVFHATHGNPEATIVGDLGSQAFLEERHLSFDCILCTQVLAIHIPGSSRRSKISMACCGQAACSCLLFPA